MNKRIDEIEVKLTILEHHVDELNDVIAKQDKLLQQQQEQLKLLYKKLAEIPTESNINLPSEEPLPPHY